MFCLLLLTLLSAAVCNFLLLHFGLTSMMYRYPAAVALSYLCFFVWVRVWLALVVPGGRGDRSSLIDTADLFNFDIPWSGGGMSPPAWGGGGGSFGGAGASSSWSAAAGDVSKENISLMAVNSAEQSAASSSSLPDIPVPDAEEGIVVILGVVLVLSIFVAGAWVIYESPDTLSDAAFQLGLSSGLLYPTRKRLVIWWQAGVAKKTLLPFAVVALFAAAFGWAAQSHCPGAVRISEVLGSACASRNSTR